jgi:hypothetical protein
LGKQVQGAAPGGAWGVPHRRQLQGYTLKHPVACGVGLHPWNGMCFRVANPEVDAYRDVLRFPFLKSWCMYLARKRRIAKPVILHQLLLILGGISCIIEKEPSAT